MKVTYYVASSLDGYIAQKGGDVSWLDNLGISMEDVEFDSFYATVDGLIMGRNTYDFIKNQKTWPYKDQPTWVCSSQTISAMPECNLQTQTSPEVSIQAAKKMGIKHLWVIGGGILASHLINKSLVTHITVTQMPVLLGGDIPLFHNIEKSLALKLKSIQTYTKGFADLHYEIEANKKA